VFVFLTVWVWSGSQHLFLETCASAPTFRRSFNSLQVARLTFVDMTVSSSSQ
jgi:hypothetical protein